jgi:NADH:ubiquinone oxidoreductase subunit 2 (subunit N)
MFLGSILAYGETKIKRFLGYTSVNQFGFLLICLSVKSIELVCLSFIYLFLYNIFFLSLIFIFINVSPFLSTLTITNFSDIGFVLQEETLLKILVTISLFSISGLPPLFLFIFKYLMLYNLFLDFYYIIILFIIILNIISAVYYFKVISNI